MATLTRQLEPAARRSAIEAVCSSRCVHVILAHGPCISSLYRSNLPDGLCSATQAPMRLSEAVRREKVNNERVQSELRDALGIAPTSTRTPTCIGRGRMRLSAVATSPATIASPARGAVKSAIRKLQKTKVGLCLGHVRWESSGRIVLCGASVKMFHSL